MFPSGALVVAKLKGYPPWPSIVAPASNGITQKIVKRIHQTHVVFLEYRNQHAWVPRKDIQAFTSSEEFKKSGFGVRAAAATAARMSSMSEEERFALLNSGSSGIGTEDSALKTTRRLKRIASQGTSIGQRKKRRFEEESNEDQEDTTNANKDDELAPKAKRNDKVKVGTNKNKKKTSENEKQAMGGCDCGDKVELSIEKISVKMSTKQLIQVAN